MGILMDHSQIKQYLLSFPGATEDFPYGPDSGVYKVRHKLFAVLAESEGVSRVNLKCDPDEAIALRETYESILPGYHMNKRHWNTIILDGSVPSDEIRRLIDNSYIIVVNGLQSREREFLETNFGDHPLLAALSEA